MSQDGQRECFDVFECDVVTSFQQSAGFGSQHELLAGAGAGAPVDLFPDPGSGCRIFGAGGADQIEDKVTDVVRERDESDSGLAFEDFGTADNGSGHSRLSGRGAIDDLSFFIAAGVIDDDIQQKAVALGFGQRVGAFLFDGVLSGEYEEWLFECVGGAADRDFVFLHRFQQGGLSFGWRAIDFVGQQHLCEDGTAIEDEIAVSGLAIFLDNIGAGDIGRHQVGRELDTVEGQCHGIGERADHEGFGESWDAFEEAVTAGEDGDEQLFDNVLLTDDDAGDFGANFIAGRDKALCALLIIGREGIGCAGHRSVFYWSAME